MYVNGKVIPVETVPGMGTVKENDGEVNSNMIYLKCYKNFYKCYNVPPPSTTIKSILKRLLPTLPI
jgi:hypothetical protein